MNVLSVRRNLACAVIIVTCGLGWWCAPPGLPAQEGEGTTAAPARPYRSPFAVAVSPDGKTVYATDGTATCVTVLDAATHSKRADIALRGRPRGLCLSPDGKTLYVAEWGAGTVAVLDTLGECVTERIPVGRWPTAVALAAKSKRLFVCNQDLHSVSVIDLSQPPGKPLAQIQVVREPIAVAITPDERTVVVTNLLPDGVGTDPALAATVSILDAARLTHRASVKLPPGSTAVSGVCLSPDGRWAYVVHALGHFNLPMTQLDRGWVHTFALSMIDVAKQTRLATVLLDDLTRGAADPAAVVCARDGGRLWVSIGGTHEVSVVEIGLVHELLNGRVPPTLAAMQDGSLPNVWVRIQQDRTVTGELAYDLTALSIAGAIRRVPSGGKGPRGLALSTDGRTLYVANYYAGSVAALAAADGKWQADLPLGAVTAPDRVRRGEIFFHDATEAFQHWHSCASCHPNDGRVDGLRWDFLRDGIGNGKDTPSLVYLDKTEPLNRRATRETARECSRTGIAIGYQIEPTPQNVDDLLAYLVSLRPEPSPYLTPDGKPSASAVRGKQLYEGKANCAGCHPAPYFTDRKVHDVGTVSGHYLERDGLYDTPSLIEAYRTAPYLHDGRARTIRDVLTTHNQERKHGKVEALSAQELDDLVQYVLSL